MESYHDVVFTAARDGKLRRLKIFLENRTPEVLKNLVSFSSNNGATPLVIASKNGHLDVIDFLVDICNADVDQPGTVEFDGETIEEAPPLWCAAAAGHLEVVQALLNYGASIDKTTKTKSTPLRAACFDGHLHIVQYLVSHGANIELANRHGHTCLMIACYKGRYKIAKYLLDCGADVNRKSIKGNTALHDCAESGSLEIMHLLLKRGAKMDRDSYGVTPLLAAALTGHRHIVELIISLPECKKEERIAAFELLGATFVDKKRDMLGALDLWRRALREKSRDPDHHHRSFNHPIAAYDNVTEATSVDQLEEIFSDPDQMRMQALYVRERILGPVHPDTTYYIRYRGAVYADTGDFDRCIKLWMHALDMQQKALEPLSPMTQTSLLSFAELFSFMMSKAISTLKFCDLFAVFQRALHELHAAIKNVSPDVQEETDFHRTLVVLLHFIGLLCKLKPHLAPQEEFEFKKAVYHLVRLGTRGNHGWTPLHLACYRDYTCHSSRFPMWEFPMADVVELLLSVSASPHVVDNDKNTPLHIAASNKPLERQVIKILLQHGAHLDAKNARGEAPIDLARRVSSTAFSDICPLQYTSLQCLCAQAINQCKIPYDSFLTKELQNFVKDH